MKKNGRGYRRAGSGFLTLVFVLVLAVGAGYGVTKYIIQPYILGQGQDEQRDGLSQGDNLNEGGGDGVVDGQQDITDADKTAGSDDGSSTQTGETGQDAGTEASTQPAAPAEVIMLYSLQYGSFSTPDAAASLVVEMEGKGVPCYVQQVDGSYKVLGRPYMTKEKAKAAADAMADEDVFVAETSITLDAQAALSVKPILEIMEGL